MKTELIIGPCLCDEASIKIPNVRGLEASGLVNVPHAQRWALPQLHVDRSCCAWDPPALGLSTS